MKKGKYMKARTARRSGTKRLVALTLAMVLLIGGVVGGTLAWLTDSTTEVKNTFTTSDIKIKLDETNVDNTVTGVIRDTENSYKMIPGWAIDKDPKVTVLADSEDCWLFVKITESTTPDLDAYISYAIADGWQIVAPTVNDATLANISTLADEIVIGRKVYKDDATKAFDILGAGSYTDPMDPQKNDDSFEITWNANQVCVKPSVTEEMMTAIANTKPTLNFQAYAVQLYKSNGVEFNVEQAWAQAQTIG